MPIRNMGTLLENIVLVEALRIFAAANPSGPIDFLSSFAMPPLSEWRPHATDYGFSESQLDTLQAGHRPAPSECYQALLWSCLQQPPGQPNTLGPNGAVLCRMLAHHIGCPTRLWLNDIPEGHYGNALPGLSAIDTVVQKVLELPTPPATETVVSGERWPDSMTKSHRASLRETLASWVKPAHARLGFLDPMRYRVNHGRDGETDSSSHQEWLRLIAKGDTCPVISVHFTGHNNWNTLRREIEEMRRDGIASGYPCALVARHSYYHVVCNIRSHDDPNELAIDLKRNVEAAWESWFQTIGRTPNALDVTVMLVATEPA